jgi:hypothetical protein
VDKKGYGIIQHLIVNYPLHKQRKEPVTIFYGIMRKNEGPFRAQTLNRPKLVQLDKVLYKWCTAVVVKETPQLGCEN